MIFSEIRKTIEQLPQSVSSPARQNALSELSIYLQKSLAIQQRISLNFICTHNSRRSLLAQAWAQVMSGYFGIENLTCYSGGTEATEIFPEVLKALKNAGFEISTISEGMNPVHAVKFADSAHPVIGFSKKFDHPFNPRSEFAAIMTCAEADETCPFVPGAEKRISIAYEDPKRYDNTPEQTERYQERGLQIASEMHFIFSQFGQKT